MDREILGDGEVPQVPMPDMQGLENFLQPLGLTLQHAIKFIDGYTTNCAVCFFSYSISNKYYNSIVFFDTSILLLILFFNKKII